MKRILFSIALFLLLSLGLTPAFVEAADLKINPSSVITDLGRGSSKNLEFTISGLKGTLYISSENLPIAVTPLSVNVVEGSKIIVTIKCDEKIPLLTQTGSIIFSAKEGISPVVTKVKCRISFHEATIPPVKTPVSTTPVIPPVKTPVSTTPVIPPVKTPVSTTPVIPPVKTPVSTTPVIPPVKTPVSTTPVIPPVKTPVVPASADFVDSMIVVVGNFVKSYGEWIAGTVAVLVIIAVAGTVYMIRRKNVGRKSNKKILD